MRHLTHMVFASLLCVFGQNHSIAAGFFNPIEGAEITQSPFAVSWETSASQQWVRVYDAKSGEKFFDSGRLRSSSGSVFVDVPENISDISVIFYEFTGSWRSQERTYVVNIGGNTGGGGDSGGGTGNVIVSDRINCKTDERGIIIPEFPSEALYPVMTCALTCPNGEFLIATTCNAEYSFDVQGFDRSITPFAATMEYSSPSSASCSLYGDYRYYINLVTIPSDLEEAQFDNKSVYVYGAGACMSLPD